MNENRNDDYLDMARARSKKGYNNFSRKSNIAYKKISAVHGKKNYNPSNSSHIVVKVTGGATTKSGVLSKLDYDCKNGKEPTYNSDGLIIEREDLEREVDEILSLTKANKGSKKTYHLVFSMKNKVDSNLLKDAVLESLKSELPDNNFYLSCHTDTDNNHVHVVIFKQNNETRKNLNINKSKLNSIKKLYAINLIKRGVKANFKSMTDRQGVEERSYAKEIRKNNRKANNVFEIMDYGSANYQFKSDGKSSYYMILKNKNGKIKHIWSNGLKDSILKSAVSVGDSITIKESGKNEKGVKQWDIAKYKFANDNKLTGALKVIDYGHANYKFMSDSKDSFYVMLEDDSGKGSCVWSKQLGDQLIKNNISVGDMINLNKNVANDFIVDRIVEEQDLNIRQKNEKQRGGGYSF